MLEFTSENLALSLFQTKAELGDVDAMHTLGEAYEIGYGVPQDVEMALMWYQKAADAGHEASMKKIGDMYYLGNGVSQDNNEAAKWYRKAANAGNASAMHNLGVMYNEGTGVPQDFGKAMKWLKKGATAGNVDAIHAIGFMYHAGLGVSQDYAKALEWFQKSAAAGNAYAMFSIGVLYAKGQGVRQDYNEAVKWLRKGAKNKDGSAMAALGQMYKNGTGVSQDYRKARTWYQKAVDAGNLGAQASLGDFYMDGLGVRKNYRKAMEYYKKAASTGSLYAMERIGDMYKDGLGVEQSYSKALKLYHKVDDTDDEPDENLKQKISELSAYEGHYDESDEDVLSFKTMESEYEEKNNINNNSVSNTLSDQMKELDQLVGLATVKQDVHSLVNVVKIRRMREQRGLKQIPMSLHLVFTGNPGTGKTTVARLLAKIYKSIGVLSKGHLIETDRSGLVGGYVGQTALKVQDVVNEAMGGILFIDEAYTLAGQGGNDYGQEAIDTLLKAMEDHRDDFIVIVAGYTNKMDTFLNSNPGLRSRFNKYIEFPDYTSNELIEIFNGLCKNSGLKTTTGANQLISAILQKVYEKRSKNFANGRTVRNLYEKVLTAQANRLSESSQNMSDDALVTLSVEDVKTIVPFVLEK